MTEPDLNHAPRTVTLRDERQGRDSRYLRAYLDQLGNLHIDGQDLGPGTASVSTDGEYEWFQTIQAADLPRLLLLLEERPEAPILDVLEANWTGARSAELERQLRESDIPVERYVQSG